MSGWTRRAGTAASALVLGALPAVLPCCSGKEETPATLMEAARKGDVKAVKSFLARGADPNGRNRFGATPLHMAVTARSIAVVRLLLEGGADPNAATRTGATPLHLAAFDDSLEIAKALAARGAKVNARNRDRATPLHMAACKGHRDMILFLLKRGADPKARDRNGNTPAYWARVKGWKEAGRLLEEAARRGKEIRPPGNEGGDPSPRRSSGPPGEGLRRPWASSPPGK